MPSKENDMKYMSLMGDGMDEKTARQLKAIIENINGGVSVAAYGSDGSVRLAYANDRYYSVLGYTKQQFLTELKSHYEMILPEDARYAGSMIASVRSTRKPATFRFRIRKRDGGIAHLQCSSSVASIEGFSDTVLLSVVTDITALVEAEELLRQQKKQMTDLVNTTPGGIAVIEINPEHPETLRTTYYNDSFYSYSGYEREEYNRLLQNNEMHFVFTDDIPVLMASTKRICENGVGGEADSVAVRCHTKDGGYRWLLLTGRLVQKRGDICVINVILVDITDRKAAEDKARISEEMFRIAAEADRRAVIVYDVKANACRVESRSLFSSKLGETYDNVPDSLIEKGIAAPDSANELHTIFERIRRGDRQITSSLRMKTSEDDYQWFECNATVIFDADGKPDHAVLVFHNITEQRVKEAVYKKWQQSIETRPPESYTLFRSNLSKESSLDQQDGTLLKIKNSSETRSFNARTLEYAEQYVLPEDRQDYIALLDSDALLAMFYRGEHTKTMEYREMGDNGEVLWRRLTVEMVEYMDSSDVQAFLMYEDIDERKKSELKEKELAETDPLTGALNRVVFSGKVDGCILREPSAQHALLMMDMDGFKLLNDSFGHVAGDQALMDITAILRSLLGKDDLVCRLGGDEFLLWMRNVPYDAVIEKRAQQICEQVRKVFSTDVQITASMGVAVYPRDGRDFDVLYHNADRALYKVKNAGKDSFAFFSSGSDEEAPEDELKAVESTREVSLTAKPKRRMLIIDASEASRLALMEIFQSDFIIETAKNGGDAMIRMRHFGASISVVLLELMMPGIDGFEILRRMQNNVEMRTTPVIALSADDDYNTFLRAIECGAADYVAKPVDVNLIKIRVQSAISKAENERLRAQNSYLQLQRDEEIKYHTVLDSTGTVVVEYNWRNHVFIYDSTISKHIAGNFNHRSLWQVLLVDLVAESHDIKALQEAILNLANNRDNMHASMLILLKTPKKTRHWFRVNVYKQVDEFGLAEKMIITFNDVHEEVLANDRLRFQATRDELTGLYNRSGFIEKAAEMIASREAGYYVMACLDIERFKVINDQYGSAKGDEVLCKYAHALSELYDSEGGICSRITADNFAVLYPKRLINSPKFAEARRVIERPDSSLPPLRFYTGRCYVDDKSLSVSAIYDRASIAKETVKGRYDTYVATYDEAMRTSILRQQRIISQMKGALENGQFDVWLQPQFNHATGRLYGAEALVRWIHPDEGVISPAEFIPIFERNGFVYEVDKYVWEKTCALLRKWLDGGLEPVPVSVNISRYDILRPDLIDVIKKLVSKYDLPADLLRLEITESAFSDSTGRIISVVRELAELGFVVEIDDFGSGYSSLNTLKDVPAQVLKMDMRFLENDSNAQRGGSIIESVIRMARWLGMSVIAEGVETIEQADYLKSIGCEYVQGYLYARPTKVTEYEKMFAEGKTERRSSALQAVDTWDNNAFWNPKSMETLIFNSYVGGACIFEYCDGKTELIRYNDEYAELFREHFSLNDMPFHRDIMTFMDDDSRTTLGKCINKAIDTRKEASCEINVTGADGARLSIRVTVRQLAQAGVRRLFYCVAADVTAQRAAERGEREAASQIAAIMDNINSGVTAVCLKKGKPEMLFSNDRYYSQLGYTREQFGEEVSVYYNAIHPDDRSYVWSKVHEAIEGKESVSLDYRCVRRDGDIIYVRSNLATCRIDGFDGDVIITAETDISELVEAQRDIARTSGRLQAIMNSIDGGVAAYITRNGKPQYLFANDRYYSLLGYEKEELAARFTVPFETIHPDDRERTRALVRQAAIDIRPFGMEFRVILKDGGIRWLSCNITIVDLPDINEPVQLSCLTDITAQREADRRLRFINELAGEILSQPDNDTAIRDTLGRLIAYFGAERSYIVELDFERGVSNNTYEICAEGVVSEMNKLRNIPFSENDYWYKTLVKRNFFIIKNVDALDESENDLRELLTSQDIRSIMLAPLWADSRLIGFMGLDNPVNAPDEMEHLTAIADYVAVMLTRRDLSSHIERGDLEMQQLMNDTPGGFCRMALREDDRLALLSANEGFCRMLGMTEDEVKAAYGDNMLLCLKGSDADAYFSDLKNAYPHSNQFTSKCRLRKKDGGSLRVMIFSRVTRDEHGEIYLNSYFTDLTEQMEKDAQQRLILDNLPCGAALYEFDGAELYAIHLNKRYEEITGSSEDSAGAAPSPMIHIHPDDRATVLAEVKDAIAHGRDGACDVRVLCKGDEYRYFHVAARISSVKNGRYSLYTTYSLISQRELTFREMIPFIFSTIMESSTDLAFAKGRDFRYICCSHSFATFLGLSGEDDVIGKTDYELFPKEIADAFRKGDCDIYATGKPIIDLEEMIPSSNDRPAYTRMSKHPLRNTVGEIVGLYGVGRDITKNKETDVQLKLMTDSIPGGLASFMCSGKKISLLYYNQGFCDLFGMSGEEYLRETRDDVTRFVFDADRHRLTDQYSSLVENGTPIDCIYRICTKSGGYRWIHHRALISDRQNGSLFVNAALFDITEQQEEKERLAIREEEYRLAAEHSGRMICRYIIAEHTLIFPEQIVRKYSISERMSDIPDKPIKLGRISRETVDAYRQFYEDIARGRKKLAVTFQKLMTAGWRWVNAQATTIFNEAGEPVSAVISYADVTDEREKETVYKKWQQSLESRDPGSYSLFRCNLNNNDSYDTREGTLLTVQFGDGRSTFNERTAAYVNRYVYEGDRESYLSFVNADTMLAEYYRGHRSDALEYREKTGDGGVRWLRLSVDLVESLESSDVEAFMMYENIDERKKAELDARHRAETDPLTGLLNRSSFFDNVNRLIQKSDSIATHAFLMLDIDGFKLLNDTFGHAAGDEALIEVARKTQSLLRQGDLLGRLGGDEFVIFLSNIISDENITKKAAGICHRLAKAYNYDTVISASIGISVYPRDGADSQTLYEKADMALYAAKESGRNTYRLYEEGMPMHGAAKKAAEGAATTLSDIRKVKRRMLIVGDSQADSERMKAVFGDEYIIDRAADGSSALSRMRYYGSALSVVLLDLDMQGMKGEELITRAQNSPEMHDVPVVVLSGDNEACLHAIRCGASDFVTKPPVTDLLRLRVDAAISRAENQRLRAQNSYLQHRDASAGLDALQ